LLIDADRPTYKAGGLQV